ncbi:MAG: thiamine pyrophosphate-dependent enzyme [Acidobacteriota bacterium]
MTTDARLRPPNPALARLIAEQADRSDGLIAQTPLVGRRFESKVLPLRLDPAARPLDRDGELALAALEKTAAATAVRSLASLAQAGDIDHLGGGLELIPPLLMTLAWRDDDARRFTIEHGHTSIGYYAALAALGFLPEERVIDAFRRSLDVAGHVSWVPGGTELSSGRLGVIVPVAVGQALGLRAHKGQDAAVICHCGDAGWISGQALNGMIGASLHHAPVVFVMHRNGIQLSGPTSRIMSKDPRPILSSLGVRVVEIPSLHDRRALHEAYGQALTLARTGQPALIYPVGFRSRPGAPVTVRTFGDMYGIGAETRRFAERHNVPLETEVWIPGSLMSFRDSDAMLECLFYVNGLPGGGGHHDGGMKGRAAAAVLAGPMLQLTAGETAALQGLRAGPSRVVVSTARPEKGSRNLVLEPADWADVTLPGTHAPVTARAGSEAAYAMVAKKYPARCFFVSCDLDPSTKLGKAASLVDPGHHFEMSIQELAAALMANGLSFSSREPQLNVFATFAAFAEGIAREAFEFWRYQRNLTGRNEGLNVIMHLSHVGACTGRDHFSGWSLDWINLALGYLPYLDRFYAPADARAAFIAVKDAASRWGGHILGVPRDTLPVLAKAGSDEPLWNTGDAWTSVTPWREHPEAGTAVLAMGAPSYLAGQAADAATAKGRPADVHIINGFPVDEAFVASLAGRYRRIVTLEDGLIGSVSSGLRGMAGYFATVLGGRGLELDHIGITDPQVAPSEHYRHVWEHYGMTADALLARL